MSRSANEPDARFHRMGTELYLPCGDHAKIEATRQRLLAELVNDPLASRVGSGPAVRRFGAVRAEAAAARDAADVASVTLSELDQQRGRRRRRRTGLVGRRGRDRRSGGGLVVADHGAERGASRGRFPRPRTRRCARSRT